MKMAAISSTFCSSILSHLFSGISRAQREFLSADTRFENTNLATARFATSTTKLTTGRSRTNRSNRFVHAILFVFCTLAFPSLSNAIGGAPPTPTGLSAPSTDGDGAYTISWNASSGSSLYYELQEKFGAGAWMTIHSGSARLKAVTGRAAGTYYYKVAACSNLTLDCSSWSGTKTVTVQAAPSTPATPSGPTTDYNGSYTINWSTSTNSSSYRLEEKVGAVWTQIYSGSSLSKAISSNSAGTYSYRVKGCNTGSVCSSWSGTKVVTVQAAPSIPATPTGPTTDYNGSYTINWSSSTNSTSYRLEEKVGTVWTQIYSGSSLSKAINKPAGTYSYRVKGCNVESVCSSWSGTKTVTVQAAPSTPATPSGPTTDYNGSYTINWSSSTNSTSYRLEEKVGAIWTQIYSGSSLSKAISSKPAGTYSYRVRGCNVESICSSWSGTKTVTVQAAPSTPATPSGPTTDYNGSYTINWSSSTNSSSYRLEEKVGAIWTQIYSGSSLSKAISSKPAGTYSYRVKGCNVESVCSSWSGTKTVTVQAAPSTPATPTGPTTDYNGSYTINWSASTNSSSYRLEEKVGAIWTQIYSGSSLSKAISSKPAGTYSYRVKGCNVESVCSSWSGTKTVTVQAAPSTPATPTGPTTDYNGSYTINWSSSTNSSSYRLEEQVGAVWTQIYSGSSLSKAISSKSAGTYSYRVKGCNAESVCSSWSGTKVVTVQAAPSTPATPTGPTTDYNGSYTINWSSSTNSTSYRLEEQVGAVWTQIYSGSSLSKAISSNSAGTYSYRVKGCNVESVCSSWSGTKVVTVQAAPSTPATPTGPTTDYNGSYTINWSSSTNSSSYRLEEKVGAVWTQIYSGSSLSKAISSKPAGTYSYRVKGCNAESVCSSWSGTKTVTVQAAPSTPDGLTGPLSNESGSYTIAWSSSTNSSSYRLEEQVDTGNWAQIYSGTALSFGLTDQAANSYTYRVKGCNVELVCSSWSSTHTVVVLPPPTPPPAAPSPVMASDPGANLESDQTGTTSGSFRVDESGSATYSIPIVTAAGTAGVAPEISLNYSSGGGNGIAGMGWSIGGMSAITRCKQTYDQDRNPLPITWTNSDRFCLDGQRLLLENSSQAYGAADTTYRTEVDNGAIVTIKGSVSGEPDYFEVKRKDGSTTYYGKSPNDVGNVSAKSGGAAGQTFIWGIRQFEDNIGNPIWFDYDNDADGQRIKTIYWAFGLGRGPSSGHGARVDFIYTEREDDRTGYVAGVALSTKKRLGEIKSYNVMGSDSLIRHYKLEYNENITAPDDISRLTSIEECAGIACLPKTIFDWRVPTTSGILLSELSTLTLAESSDLSDLTLADVNGDGMMDLVWLEGAAANAIMNYAISDGTSLTQRVFSGGSMEYSLPGGGEKLTPIDYNLDGRYDIAYWNESTSRWRIIISEPQTDGTWRLQNTYALTPIVDEEVTFVDIDSNGTTDAVWATGEFNRQLERSLLEKSGQAEDSSAYYHFGTPESIGSATLRGNIRSVAADLNGDGRVGIVIGSHTANCDENPPLPPICDQKHADLINVIDPTSVTPSFSVYANLNNEVLPGEHVRISGLVTTDVNADGLSDFFYPVFTDPNTNNDLWNLAINKGDGNFDIRQQINPTLKLGGVERPQFVDWNGDHHPDLVWKDTTGSGEVRVLYWDAPTNAFSAPQNLTYLVSNSTNESVYFPDMNGDGVPDMVKIDTSTGQGNVTIYTRKIGSTVANRASNRIEKITNGIGAETQITYEPLSYSDHYERMVVDTTPEAPGGGTEHCFVFGGANFCVNPPVTAASVGDFYTKINGDWEVPTDSVALTKNSPVIEVAGPMYVVTDVVGSAPAAVLASPGSVTTAATSALEYHYYEAKVQAAGRGFLGFQQLKTVDTIANVKTTTQYRQDWPFTGLPIATVVSSAADNVIGGGSTAWDILEWTASMPMTATNGGTAALGPLHVEQIQNTSNAYDLVRNGAAAGVLLSTTVTDTTYDSEANAEEITVTTTNQVTLQDELIATTTNVFDSTSFSLWQGRLKDTTVVTNRPTVIGSANRHSTFQYYLSGPYLGMLEKEIIEPGHVEYELATTHFYDAHGNRVNSTISDGTTTRCSAPAATAVYDSSGRYLDQTYDCLGRLTTEVVARNGFGLPTKVDTILDATLTTSRLTTNIYYGAMGREYFRAAEDGSFKKTYLSTTTTNCPAGTSYKVTEYTAGGGTAAVCFDVLARETRKLTLGFDGQWDAQDTNYDNKGRVLHKSEPYELLNGAAYWTSIEYDLLDRATKTTLPDLSWSQAAYSGFDTTTTISYQNQTRTEKRNALGDIIQAKDNLQGTINFTYDNLGNLATTTDPGGNITVTTHNDLGQKTSMKVPHSDPAKGLWLYEFNHFGEMKKQTNANGHTSEMTYDGLGRMKTRIDKFVGGGTDTDSIWTYDTSPDGLGKLDSVLDGQAGFAKAILYDSLGRADEVITNFDAGAYFEKSTYDQYGRVYQVFDAAGNGTFADHGTQNLYGSYGHLTAVGDAAEVNGAPRTIYRLITGMNARGQVTTESLGVDTLGNAAVSTTFNYYPATGRMKDIEALDSSGAYVQDLYYEWNDVGSLTKRQDTRHQTGSPITLSENLEFGYDGLNRLTSHGEAGQAVLAVTYDALGNIKTKTGVTGTYSYGNNAGPNALTQLNGQIYNYDNNGNNISGGGRSIVYSTFDKPTSITKGGNTVSFAYGVDRNRYRRIDNDSNGMTTTRYIGNVEIIERPNGTQERKRYIAGVAIETGIYSGGSETSRKTIYTLKDHLGSLDVILDDAGQIEQKLSFGPWGQRRDASNWKEVDTNSLLIDLGPGFDVSRTTRGFTGHEMVDSVGIVHMNGRIYDPFLGRFLQSDNYVQDPTNTQSHNRYSYVWNNPLNATDPSGEFVFSLIAIAIAASVEGIKLYAVAAIFAVAGTLDALIAGADLSDAFLTGIISGLSAGAFAKLGTVLAGKLFAVKVFAHGMVGGITSVLQGGKFGHGFASAAFTAGATSFNNSAHIGGEGFSWKRVAVGAAIGGSASKISGGKFANGALTGAFSQALNHERHEEIERQKFADLPPEHRQIVEALEKDSGFQKALRDARSAAEGHIARQAEFGENFEVITDSQRPAGARVERGIFSRFKVNKTDVGEFVLDGGTTHGTSNVVGGRAWRAMASDRRPVAIVGVYPGTFYPNTTSIMSLSLQWSVPVPVFTFSPHGAELFMGSIGPIAWERK